MPAETHEGIQVRDDRKRTERVAKRQAERKPKGGAVKASPKAKPKAKKGK